VEVQRLIGATLHASEVVGVQAKRSRQIALSTQHEE
jgi:hypothetical protein